MPRQSRFRPCRLAGAASLAFWVVVVSAPAVIVILLSLAAASSQEGVFRRPGRPATDRPFHFLMTRGRLHQPSSGYGIHLRPWIDAIGKHQPGEADASARAVSDWTPDQLWDVVLASETSRKGTLEETRTHWRMIERAVLLHTDIATLAMADVRSPDVTWVSDRPSLHFGVALELVDWLRGQTREEDAFARAWYRATAAFLVSQQELVATPIFMERATSQFRGDPDLLVLAGAVHELLASPRVQEGAELQGVDTCGTADDNLIAAEEFYRQALDTDASHAEARTRLGHVIGQRGRHEQALAELKRAFAGTPPPALQYFMHLFVGEEEEALNRADAAGAAYERAIALRPEVQFAYLALSRLERRRGNGSAAIKAVQNMLQLSEEERRQSDPWAEYYAAGQARRATDLLEQFREPFRKRQ